MLQKAKAVVPFDHDHDNEQSKSGLLHIVGVAAFTSICRGWLKQNAAFLPSSMIRCVSGLRHFYVVGKKAILIDSFVRTRVRYTNILMFYVLQTHLLSISTYWYRYHTHRLIIIDLMRA